MTTSTRNIDQKIDYLEFPAKDFDMIEAFYSNVFNWQFKDFGPEYRAFHDDKLDGGFYQSEQVSATASGAVLVIIYAVDLQATYSKVKQHGGVICNEIFAFPGGWRFQFKDPHGNELGVWTDKDPFTAGAI